MNRGKPLRADPQVAAERRRRREERRRSEPPRPEDQAREARRAARDAPQSARAVPDADGSRAWNAAAVAEGCAMCRSSPEPEEVRRARPWEFATIDGHHCIPKRDLKRWGLHRLLWDTRNMLALCRFHHFRHEKAYQRVPRALLKPSALEFADEIGARFMLENDRIYPPGAA